MGSTNQQSAFTFRNGKLTIQDDVILLNRDYRGMIRRHYRHHKLAVGTVCFLALLVVLAIPIAIIFDPGYVVLERDVGLLYLSVIVVPTVILFALNRKQSHFTLENSIDIERVDYVLVRPPTRITTARFRIIYDEESKIRQFYANYRGFGEKEQYEQGRRVFDAHDIEVREE